MNIKRITIKRIITIIVIGLLGVAFFFWYTHRSIEQVQTPQDLVLKEQLAKITSNQDYNQVQLIKSGHFNPEATDSDFLHNGSGDFSLVSFQGDNKIVLEETFKVTNGPAYKLYLLEASNIETEEAFEAIKAEAYYIADIKQFSGYQTFTIPKEVDPNQINSALIWCEMFSQFITSGNLR